MMAIVRYWITVVSGLWSVMNEQNLRPGEYRLSQEEAKRGGLKSVEVRRRKKEVRESLLRLLFDETNGETMFDKMNSGLLKRIIETGDPQAYEKLMEYAGLSVKQETKEEELKLKREELKLKKSQVTGRNETDVEDLSGIWGMVNEPDTDN